MNFRKEGLPLENIFKQYNRVAYVPLHAYEDINHPDVEYGFVSSVTDKFVFVKFAKKLAWAGWAGTTSQACDPSSLHIVHGKWPEVTT